MTDLTTYSNKAVVVTVDGRRVTHFVDGDDVVMLERNSDRGTPQVGADGRSVVSFSSDESATLVLKLQHSSPAHKQLTRLDRRTTVDRAAKFPVNVTETDTGEGGSSVDCVIVGRPSVAFGTNASEREWRIYCPRWDWNTIEYIEAS